MADGGGGAMAAAAEVTARRAVEATGQQNREQCDSDGGGGGNGGGGGGGGGRAGVHTHTGSGRQVKAGVPTLLAGGRPRARGSCPGLSLTTHRVVPARTNPAPAASASNPAFFTSTEASASTPASK